MMSDAAAIGDKLGDLVRARRAMLRLSLDELAGRVGCTKSHIWEIEQGRSRNPTLGLLLGLAAAFAITPARLLAELCDDDEPELRDPGLATLSVALAEVRRLLPELEALREAGRA